MTSSIYTGQQALVYDNIIDQVLDKRFAVQDHFVTVGHAEDLRKNILDTYYSGEFKQSKIGHFDNLAQNKAIRNDQIRWLDHESPAREYSTIVQQIIGFGKWLNRYCYAGINDLEIHSTVYPDGAFYKRHLDTSALNKKRLYTFILYLNKDWNEGDGGELKVYLDEQTEVIQPLLGRLVFFESDKIPHEVLKSNFERVAITGWFKYDELKSTANIFAN